MTYHREDYTKVIWYWIRVFSVGEINSANIVSPKKIKYKLSLEYYNYLDIFDRIKINIFSLYYLYNHKLEFNNNFDKIKLLKSRIYSILEYKLK